MAAPRPVNSTKPLRVAVVGAGPGGLATAIHLLRLKDVELSVFDQARELREVGAVSVGDDERKRCIDERCTRESV